MPQNSKVLLRDAISEAGGSGHNEDTFGSTTRAAWVIDGVTGLFSVRVDGCSAPRWFARTFSDALTSAIEHRQHAPTLDLINGSLGECLRSWNDKGLRDAPYPAATFAMVRLINDQVELTSVGDCSIRFDSGNGRVAFSGDRSVEPFERKTLEQLQHLQSKYPLRPHSEIVEKLKTTMSSNRQYLNKVNGYNALTLCQILERNIVTDHIEAWHDRELLLTTDGFSRYTDLLQIGSEQAFWDAASSRPLKDLLKNIRAAENQDGECRRYPRVKISDDATALRVSISHGT
jgi:hypothetical protein